MDDGNLSRGVAGCLAPTVASKIGRAAFVLTLSLGVSAHSQTIVAEGDVYIDGNPAAGLQAVPLDVATVDVGSANFNSFNNVLSQGRLALDDGADLIVGELNVGDVEFNSFGVVEASGFGTSIDTNALSVGGTGDGVLILRDGAMAVTNGSAIFGSDASANQPGRGDFELQGLGSTLQVLFSQAEFNFGRGQVTDGARLLVGGPANFGSNGDSFDLTLDNGGRFEATGSVNVGSTNSNIFTQSRVTVGAGSEFAFDSAVVFRDGAIQLDGGRIRANSAISLFGTMSGYGEMSGFIRVLANTDGTPGGLLSVAAGRELNVRFGSSQSIPLGNSGRIENAGTITLGAGRFTNDLGGSYIGRNSTLRARVIENNASIDLVEGFNHIDAELLNFAESNFETPRVTVSGGATALFTGDVVNDGQVRVEAGSTATFTQNVSGSGTFDGTGDVVFLGSFTPGNSPGFVSFGGDLVLGDSSTSEFEIEGVLRGDEYDAVDVGGSLELGGTLRALVTADVSVGDVFTLFDVEGGINGTFDQVEFEAALPSALSL
ncbi:MAG: hypothetical protein AAF593_16420, partial [Planctomycetota bacterium]